MSEEISSSPARTSSVNIMVLFAALIPLAFVMGFWVSDAIELEVVPTVEETIIVSMTIDYGDGNTTIVENVTVENMTVYDLLVFGSNVTRGNYTYASTYYSAYDSLLMDSISGYTNRDDGKDWSYSVNGVSPWLGADKYWLEDGNMVKWEFKVFVWPA